MKMYILVRDDIPLGFAMVAVAHASLTGYLKFQDDPEMKEWLEGPFFKVVCKANAKEFANAKQVADHLVLTESALDQQEVAIAFKPRREWPSMFKFLRLYREPPNASKPAVSEPKHFGDGTPGDQTSKASVPCAAPDSYELQPIEVCSRGDAEVAAEFRMREAGGALFSVVPRGGQVARLYPAFQFDASVDHSVLREAIAKYRRADLGLSYLWDFLRTVHKPLGGMTGVDYLLGYYSAEFGALSPQELREFFLELVDEEVSRQVW